MRPWDWSRSSCSRRAGRRRSGDAAPRRALPTRSQRSTRGASGRLAAANGRRVEQRPSTPTNVYGPRAVRGSQGALLGQFVALLDDLVHQPVLECAAGIEPEVAPRVLEHLLGGAARALGDDLVVAVAQLQDLLGRDVEIA